MGRVLPRRAEDDERVGLYAGDGIAALSDLKGRYTLVKIDADTAIEEDKLGPQIDSTHMSGTVIVTVSPTALGHQTYFRSGERLSI